MTQKAADRVLTSGGILHLCFGHHAFAKVPREVVGGAKSGLSANQPRQFQLQRGHRQEGDSLAWFELNQQIHAPGPGEIRLTVKALGLNRAEVIFRSGQYMEQPKFPARLGYEAAGIVESVGPGVTGVKVGDAVSTAPAFSQNQYGVYGEVAIVPAAAAIWMQYVTIRGYVLFEITGDPAKLKRAEQFVAAGLATGQLTPIISKTLPLDQIVQAHRFLELNQQIGKIVVTV